MEQEVVHILTVLNYKCDHDGWYKKPAQKNLPTTKKKIERQNRG
jgi:hypothetical protein